MGIIYVRGSIKTQIPGIKPAFLTSQALAGGFFTTSATWEAFQLANLKSKKIPWLYIRSLVLECTFICYRLK